MNADEEHLLHVMLPFMCIQAYSVNDCGLWVKHESLGLSMNFLFALSSVTVGMDDQNP